MNDVEDWVAAGVPVIFSFAWKKGEITGCAVSSSDGHLAVIVGFDAAGNPIVNDPAAAHERGRAADVRPGRAGDGLAPGSGGTVYLIHPQGHAGPGALERELARRRDALEEAAVVGDHDRRSLVDDERGLELLDRLEVEVVRRLVEHEAVDAARHQLGEVRARPLAR